MAVIYFERKVIFAILNRITQGLIGVLTMILISWWFKPVEQGYYYTFGSVLGLQVIFEMGFSYVILQHSAHYFTFLQWTDQHKISGDPEKILIFELFLGRCCLIYTAIAILFLLLIYGGGMLFFMAKAQHTVIAWQLPWALMCIISAVNLLLTPFLAIIEGSNLIVKINQFKIIQNIMGLLAMALVVMAGYGLFSIVSDAFICCVAAMVWLSYSYRDLFYKTYAGIKLNFNHATAKLLPWKDDIWPMQWRIAISWISGYLINQIYTPVIFYYHDAVAAGQLGMSMAVCNMLLLLALAAIAAYNPEMCRLIARQKFSELHLLFKTILLQTLIFIMLPAIGILCCLSLCKHTFLAQRFVPLDQMALLLLGAIATYIVGAIAMLLRAFKREPFLWFSLIGAVLNVTFVWWFGKEFSTAGIALLYMSLNVFFGVPTAWLLWYKFFYCGINASTPVRQCNIEFL